MNTKAFTETAPDLTDGLVVEELPSLADFAEEPGGALPRGWYAAEIIEGYASRKGNQFETKDDVSKNGSSRNLTLCLRISPKNGEPKNMQERVNYRPSDLTPERLAFIKEVREEYKGVKGKWSDADAQRSSLAIAALGQIEKALGVRFKRTADGAIVPGSLIGKKLDVRLGIDDNGYNEVTAHAPLGAFTGKPPKSA